VLRLVAIAVSLLYFIVTDTVAAAARAIAYADSFDVVDELIAATARRSRRANSRCSKSLPEPRVLPTRGLPRIEPSPNSTSEIAPEGFGLSSAPASERRDGERTWDSSQGRSATQRS